VRRSALVAFGLVVSIAAVLLYRGAYSASDLEIVPDSVEYALAGHRLVTDGHYAITISGRDLPPRYPPWFSLLVIAPAYALLGRDPGNAIYPVTAFAIAGVSIAFAVGRRIGGTWGGALAALAVLLLPDYRQCGRLVLTDVPTATLIMASCAVYLGLPVGGTRRYLAAGLLVMAAMLLRPVSAAAAIPFAVSALSSARPGRVGRVTALVVPLAAAATATLGYNAFVYGSPWRSGYNFWCPIPYDFPALTFSQSYLRRGLALLWSTRLPRPPRKQ